MAGSWILRPNAFLNRMSALHSGILIASPGKVHSPRSHSPSRCLHILILEKCSKFARGKNHSARCLLLQPCSSAGCMLSACRSRVNHYRTIHSFPQKRIRWNAASWTKFHWESAFVRTMHNPASTLIHLKLKNKTEAHRKTCYFNHSCGVASCSRLPTILGYLLKKNPIFVGLFCTRGKSP